MNTFKQVTIASAVAAGLTGAGSAHAVLQGEPGEALLVPYALCDTANQVNTMVGITIPSTIGADPTTIPLATGVAGGGPFSTAPNTSGAGGVAATGLSTPAAIAPNLHAYFFNATSTHIADISLPASMNDFVPFDWCRMVDVMLGGIGNPDVDGAEGYLVFGSVMNPGDGALDATYAMYGEAAVIQGNWLSAAYDPVIPMADSADVAGPLAVCDDEVQYGGGIIPQVVNPLCAGMALDNDDAAVDDDMFFDLRYFLDPALAGGTDMVVWLPQNCRGAAVPTDGCNRTSIDVQVFDTEEAQVSAAIPLPNELNVIDASTLLGVRHSDTGPFGEGVDGIALQDQGYIRVQLPELFDTATAGPDNAGVAFSLISFSTSGNPSQVQTALAHELGVW